ncbi:MAG: hypothetical protein LBR97_02125 [Dysgonamonadaceae bacterium]|jgi:hypothetical protein|nr:hypothetical protein [Dysgonamonadaceae bacterium]
MKKVALIMSLLIVANLAYSQKEVTKQKGESATLTMVGGRGKTVHWYSGSCGGTLVGKGDKIKVTPQKTTTYYGRWEDGKTVSKCIWVKVNIVDTPVPPVVQKDTVYITKDTVIYKTDTVVKEKETVKETVTTVTKEGKSSNNGLSSPKSYSFGKYVGGLKNGYPEGDGKLTYSKRVQIAKHDKDKNLKPVVRFAEAGDCFVGSWGNGDIVSGTLYDRNGVVKEKIFTSKRPEPYNIAND